MIFEKRFNIKLLIAFLFLVIAILSNTISSNYIKKTFGNPPVVKDLIWEILPYYPSFIIISELIIAFSILYLLVWGFKKNKNLIPYTLTIYFCFQILRAVMIVFTPLGFPQDYSGIVPIGDDTVFKMGNYPSGHLAYPLITFLVTRKKIFILLSFLSALVLFISHSHYTIDVIGTFFIGLALWYIFEKDIKKYFLENG